MRANSRLLLLLMLLLLMLLLLMLLLPLMLLMFSQACSQRSTQIRILHLMIRGEGLLLRARVGGKGGGRCIGVQHCRWSGVRMRLLKQQ
jgi:hypothetical protein